MQADDHPVTAPGQTVVQLPGIMTMNDLRAYQARVRARPAFPPRAGRLQHGAAVEQRFHRWRGAEHPQRLPPNSRAPGDPHPSYDSCQNQQAAAAPAGQKGLHTNNIVTADKWGNIVAYTNTINFFGGSGQTVPATASCSTTR